jgi:UDP-2-acetamido-2-deoxy-ribo-hexuluronate aminotransferase
MAKRYLCRHKKLLMRSIEMVDTKTQYRKIKPAIDAAIQDILDTGMYIGGKYVKTFADDLKIYSKVNHVIPCANGTDALQIAMMALGFEPGDEIITPSYTYIATVEVMALLKLKPVFIDVNLDTFCMDTNAIESAITPKTKAIVPVHLYGHSADMEAILAIANKHNLHIIEDNAQAIGGQFTFSNNTTVPTGSMGIIGCTSFYPSKNLGCYGDGGAIFTNDDALAKTLNMVANHGQQVRYYHDLVGCNSRLDAIQAAVLVEKLKHLDNYNQARINAANYYDSKFKNCTNIKTPFRAANVKHVFHQYTLTLENVDRDELQKYLASKNIPSMIYYPVPAHKQKMFEGLPFTQHDLTNTNYLTSRVISLPIHSELDEEQQDYIAENVLAFCK